MNINNREKKRGRGFLRVFVSGLFFFVFLAAFCGIFGAKEMGYASAITENSPRYFLQGSWTWEEISSIPNNQSGVGEGDTLSYGGVSLARVKMENRNVLPEQNLGKGIVLSMLEYNISVLQLSEGKKINSESFVLKKNGVVFANYTDLGEGSKLLYSSSLQDGRYDITYQCSYKPNAQMLVRFVFSFHFFVDNTPPSSVMTSDGINIPSGTYTKGNVSYKIIDENPYAVYVKAPTSSSFVIHFVTEYNCPIGVEGLFKFKGRDRGGNESEEVSVYIDKTPPTGNIRNELGENITKSYYSKKIKYECIDNIALNRLEYKILGGSWQTYQGGYISECGSYFFRGIDKAGNISEEKSIVIDNILPEVLFFGNGGSLSYDEEVNTPSLSAQATDSSGIEKMYVKRPGESVFSEYVMNSELAGEGKYEFYAIDRAGNVSEVRKVTIDRTSPVISLFSGNTPLEWGEPTNAAQIKMEACDNLSNDVQMFVKKPGESLYEQYYGETLNAYGEYFFYAEDKALNISEEERVFRDDIPPSIFVLNSQGEREEKIFFKTHVSFEGEDEGSDILEIRYKPPGLEEYLLYEGSSLLSSEGEYAFYAKDKAGNVSITKYISIDNTPPEGVIRDCFGEKIEGEWTNSPFITYYASDSMSGVDECYVKRAGEEEYEGYVLGSQLAVEGEYSFFCVDSVGNMSLAQTLCVDREIPIPLMISKGEEQENGFVSNSSFSLWGEDDYGISRVYLKEKKEDFFSFYEEEPSIALEGEYSFYVEDFAKNKSETFLFVIDLTPPNGYLSDELGHPIPGKFFSQSFKYISVDNMGVERMEWKRESEEWEIYDGELLSSLESCEYFFRSFDKAGNLSTVLDIFFDDVNPSVFLLDQDNLSLDGWGTNAEYIMLSFEDEESGISKGYVVYPGETIPNEVQSGVRLQVEGSYLTWCVDNAGNISEEREVYIDRTPPIAKIHKTDSSEVSANFSNEPFYFQSTDMGSGVAYQYIKLPNAKEWEPYLEKSEDFAPEVEGEYKYKSIDEVGNTSNILSITYDITPPTGKVYISLERDGGLNTYSPLLEERIVHAQSVIYVSEDEDISRLEVLLPGGDDFSQYIANLPLSEEGEYAFRALDFAGNISSLSVVTLDRTPIIPIILEEEDGKVFGWFEVDAKESTLLFVNGVAVQKGEKVHTVYGGTYEVFTKDEAGNTYSKTIISLNTMGFSQLSLEEWWEIEVDCQTYSFKRVETALDFLINEEKKQVVTSFWRTDDLWNMGIPMESLDAKNAKPGTFYIYKSPEDKNTHVAYFTLARLNESVAHYASQGLKKCSYYEKQPAIEYEGEQVYYHLMEKALALTNLPILEGLRYVIDGKEIDSQTHLEEGEYPLEVSDNFGNKVSFKVNLLKSYASINLKMGSLELSEDGNSGYIEASSLLSPYYFSCNTTLSISEKAEGSGIFFVKNEQGEKLFEGGIEGKYELTTSGKYYVKSINRFGESEEVVIYISKESPKIHLLEENSLKKLKVSIEKSPQSFSKITTIKISKSEDGENFIPVQFDDYGRSIDPANLEYFFRTSGYYKVLIEDLFRYGQTEISESALYQKPFPEGNLSGVLNDGITKNTVSFSWVDEARATIEREGEDPIEYENGKGITADGKYTITLRDYDNNISTYSFSIKTTPPQVVVTGVDDGGKTSNPVSISLGEGSILQIATRNGQAFQYTQGESLTQPGIYEMLFIDNAGNQSTYTFEITENPSKTIYIYLGIAAGCIAFLALVVFIRRRWGLKRYKKSKKKSIL